MTEVHGEHILHAQLLEHLQPRQNRRRIEHRAQEQRFNVGFVPKFELNLRNEIANVIRPIVVEQQQREREIHFELLALDKLGLNPKTLCVALALVEPTIDVERSERRQQHEPSNVIRHARALRFLLRALAVLRHENLREQFVTVIVEIIKRVTEPMNFVEHAPLKQFAAEHRRNRTVAATLKAFNVLEQKHAARTEVFQQRIEARIAAVDVTVQFVVE